VCIDPLTLSVLTFAVVSIYVLDMDGEASAPLSSSSSNFTSQPFKPVFLHAPGRSPILWSRWLAMFEDWLLAVGFPSTGLSERKSAVLRERVWEHRATEFTYL
jgi:hypothetical protein